MASIMWILQSRGFRAHPTGNGRYRLVVWSSVLDSRELDSTFRESFIKRVAWDIPGILSDGDGKFPDHFLVGPAAKSAVGKP
jgi:hypothetical protein